MCTVRESFLRWKRAEAAHAEPLRRPTVPLPDLPQDLHLSEPPEETPEEPLQHELTPRQRGTRLTEHVTHRDAALHS